MRLLRFLVVFCWVLSFPSAGALAQADCEWAAGFFAAAGVDGTVRAVKQFPSTGLTRLYCGGDLASAGAAVVENVACWNGTEWSAVGGGVDGTVHSLEAFNDGSGEALYAAGDFTTAGGGAAANIARWNGSVWSALGGGVSAVARAMAVYNDGTGAALFVGGDFSTAEGIAVHHIARWNGNTWAPLGVGVDGPVYALAAFNDGSGEALYAAGAFTLAGGESANRIARWRNGEWELLDNGVDGDVFSLAVYTDLGGTALYAGGSFTTAGIVPASRVARWQNASWTALGSGVAGEVNSLTSFLGSLYAGGDFAGAGNVPASNLARWNGFSWAPLGEGTGGAVHALAPHNDGSGDKLVVGGDLVSAGGEAVRGVARFDGVDWEELGTSTTVDGSVFAIEPFNDGSGDRLWVGGDFRRAGDQEVSRVARWDGTAWEDAGGGVDSVVQAFAIHNNGFGAALYAGGNFTTASGLPAQHVARWDGASWAPVGAGTNGVVFALASFNDGSGEALYAAGFFSTAAGNPASNIARWRNGVWSGLGTGLNTAVRALVAHDDGGGPQLYAAGDFALAGGIAASRIARWDGATWSAVGSGFNNRVFSLTSYADIDGPSLYAGGLFTASGTTLASRVARWNGTSWSALGTGANDQVLSLRGYDDGVGPALYAGGRFTDAGGAQWLARWNGLDWSSLATEVNDEVRALALFDDGSGSTLHAAGKFGTAGAVVSAKLAKRIGPSAPTFLMEPPSLTPCAGENVVLRIAAEGTTPPTYQWRKDGVDIPNATNVTLLLPAVSSADDGVYDVVATDACGTTLSAPGSLEILQPATIETEPESQFACPGGAVLMGVIATGSPPLTYQWRRNGFQLPGATGDLLVLDPIHGDDAGIYDVQVSGPCNTLTSRAVTLTLAEPAEVFLSPIDQDVCPGTTVVLNVGVGGTFPFTYQWRKDGAEVLGANSDILVLEEATEADAGEYDVVVGNFCGDAVSDPARIGLESRLEIVTPPQGQNLCIGEALEFQTEASGAGSLTFQWLKDGVELEGATKPSYTVAAVTEGDAGVYTVSIEDTCEILVSDPAEVTLEEPARLTAVPASQVACPGAAVVFDGQAEGAPPLAYQWLKDGTEIPGATEASLSLQALSTDDAAMYALRASNACGSETSPPATLSLEEPAVIITQPQGQAVCRDSAVTLTVNVSGSLPIGFQWRLGGANLPGATSDRLTIEAFSEGNAGTYEVVVENVCGPVVSAPAVLTLDEPVTLLSEPVGAQVCVEAPITFSAAAAGTGPLSFQWRHDGTEIPGATSEALSIASTSPDDSGMYDVVVSNVCNEVVTVAAELVVDEPARITSEPQGGSFCPGSAAVLSALAIGTPPLTFQWRKEGFAIPGATADTYRIGQVSADTIGAYDVVISGPCGTVTSALALVALKQETRIDVQPDAPFVCQGSTAILRVDARGEPPLTFQWKKNGIDIAGAIEETLSIEGFLPEDSGRYSVDVAGACSNVTSDVVVLSTAECFHRGDVDETGEMDISDPIRIFNSLFLGAGELTCLEAADLNNDAEIDLTDGVVGINFLFLGGFPPTSPGPPGNPCGPDPDLAGTRGDLGCKSYSPCLDLGAEL